MKDPRADDPSTASRTDLVLRSERVEVDLATRQLLVDGRNVSIERRAFDLLVYLMTHADRVVDKDELWRAVWESRPVSESTLPQAVSRVRKALGGDDTEAYLSTVYGVGYRFAAAVQRIDGEATQSPSDPEHAVAGSAPGAPSRSLRLLWAAALLALALAATAWWRVWYHPANGAPIRVAVLPVVNQTGDDDLEWVRFGVLPLIDQALADDGVARVSSNNVLATLKRYPDAVDAPAQARVLQLSSGADQVIAPILTADGVHYRLELREVHEQAGGLAMSLEGEDISVLAVSAGRSLSQSLARWQGAGRAQRGLVTDDPFVNEAFARGLDARLRGRLADAARYFDTVLAAAPELLEAKYHLSLVTRRLGDWPRTDRLNQELMASATHSGNLGMLAAVQSTSGVLAWRRGDKQAARDWYQRALQHYVALGNQDYVASVTANLGILAATEANYAEAERCFGAALDHYQRTGDRYNQATTLKNLGNLYADQARFDQAEQTLLAALALRTELELPLEVAWTLSVLSDIKMARGQWSEALAYQERVLAAAREHASPLLEAQAQADLSAAYRRLGRLQDAVMAATRALTIATELDHPGSKGLALLRRGQAQHQLGQFVAASNDLVAARAIYQQLEEPPGQVRSLIADALTQLQLARLDQAEAQLQRARGLLKQARLTSLEADLLGAEGELLQRRGDVDGALAKLEQAYGVASSGQSSAARVELGGRLGSQLLAAHSPAQRLEQLAAELGTDADFSVDALAFLTRFYASRDPLKARDFALRWQHLAGDGWRPSDAKELGQILAD